MPTRYNNEDESEDVLKEHFFTHVIKPVCMNKKYYVVRKFNKQFKSIYSGDTDWIAKWFYENYLTCYDDADAVTFIIDGDFHNTFSVNNPHNYSHISLNIQYRDGTKSKKLHLIYHPDGYGILDEPLLHGQGKRTKKQFSRYSKKHFKKHYSKRRKYA